MIKWYVPGIKLSPCREDDAITHVESQIIYRAWNRIKRGQWRVDGALFFLWIISNRET